MARSRPFLLLCFGHQFLEVCDFFGFVAEAFVLLGPLIFVLVFARSWVLLVDFGLILEEVAPFDFVFLHPFMAFGQFPTSDHFERVLVSLLHLVAFDADVLGFVDLLVELGDREG